MKIYAPNKNANGVYASVQFINGVGETDNPRLMEWFRKHGYYIESIEKSVENCENPIEKLVEKCENISIESTSSVEPDFDSMTPNELRDWAKANGLGGVIKNTRNKEKLLELIRG